MKKIIFLHHSTGKNIWLGNTSKYINILMKKSDMRDYFEKYNRNNDTSYIITEQYFPKEAPYGWKNYPYDYYNIWVKNAGNKEYMEEPTLEILTKEFDVIIFKHCYPGSRMQSDNGAPDINSEIKTLGNYKLQYNALKNKMREFPQTKFIVWTPAMLVQSQVSEDEARRTKEFRNWVVEEWDQKNDNIFIFDFYSMETEGSLYMQEKYSDGPSNSHPNKQFSARTSPVFSKFIIDVINGTVE